LLKATTVDALQPPAALAWIGLLTWWFRLVRRILECPVVFAFRQPFARSASSFLPTAARRAFMERRVV